MNETLEILEKIDTFYSNSFGTLVTLTFSILAFAGILIPILIAYIQNRQVKHETLLLIKKIEDESLQQAKENENKINALLEKERKKIESQLLKLEDDLNKKLSNSEAGLFHIQAQHHRDKEFYALATVDYCTAAEGYIDGNDELNLGRVLYALKSECIEKLTATDFKTSDKLLDSINELVEKLSSQNTNGRHYDTISEIKRKLSQAQLCEAEPIR